MNLVADGMNQVNAVILDRMQSRIPLIPELAGHLIAGGGKRLRPMLTLACADLVGYAGARHYKLAAAVEFIHTATLLHDDVVDGSGMRRGRKTANIIWGNSASVLVGTFYYLSDTPAPVAPAITSGAPAAGVVGQAYSHSVTATGTPAPTFAVSSGSLPAGLSLNTVTGEISGTPTTAGTSNFDVTVSNGTLPNDSASYSIEVAAVTPTA